MIRDNVETAFRAVELTRGDYLRVLDRAAEKVKVDKLLTFNVRHFRRVWSESGDIIQEP